MNIDGQEVKHLLSEKTPAQLLAYCSKDGMYSEDTMKEVRVAILADGSKVFGEPTYDGFELASVYLPCPTCQQANAVQTALSQRMALQEV